MRCGCPVICSNAASLPEVAGDAALYFSPASTEEIENKLVDFLAHPEKQEELRHAGYQQAARFTWQKTARIVLENLSGVVGLS